MAERFSQKNLRVRPSSEEEKIVFSGVIKDGERLEIASKNKRTKYIEFEDLEPYIMSRTRRGKKIDNKYTHKNAKLIYNTGKK